MLAGDLIARMIERLRSSSAPVTLEELDQGGTDPGNVVEFLALDLPFDIEPSTGLIFPAEVDRE
jgi:hypothetical protein